MKKYIGLIIVIAVAVVGVLVFKNEGGLTGNEAGNATSTPQAVRIPVEAGDMESYTSKNFGFTMQIPKSITVTASTSEGMKEKDDTVVVKESATTKTVYVIAKSNESLISAEGALIPENVPQNSPVYISSFTVRALDDWKNVGTVLTAFVNENLPPGSDFGRITYKNIEQHTGTNVYTAYFESDTLKDDEGKNAVLPVNFMVAFSSEFKKIALWPIGQDYVFGKSISKMEYKIFDEDIAKSITFTK